SCDKDAAEQVFARLSWLMFVCNYGVKDCARPCAGKGGHTRTLYSQKCVVADRIALLNGN
ncbi:MAG: hypothetical protein P8Q92_18005, partial [Pseudoprimorskyibacter sp.]|nr:hypothetical protein [Pseudoprimorskyibacter sp.]